MTGPEHYREAEGLLQTVMESAEVSPTADPVNLAAAQVHATLALAAATAAARVVSPQEAWGGHTVGTAGAPWNAVLDG